MRRSPSPKPNGSKRSTARRGTTPPAPSRTDMGVAMHVPIQGLCTTCAHASACTFPRRQAGPVLFCEEFDGGGTSDSVTAAGARTLLPSVQRTEAYSTGYSASVTGLCATCEKRATCTFPKAEGGVWRCEEFE